MKSTAGYRNDGFQSEPRLRIYLNLDKLIDLRGWRVGLWRRHPRP
jgi:hypothetical protein